MLQCWYNKEGKEACPVCYTREPQTVKTKDIDSCTDGSGHKFVITAHCSDCNVDYQFYQDEIGVSLKAAPRDPDQCRLWDDRHTISIPRKTNANTRTSEWSRPISSRRTYEEPEEPPAPVATDPEERKKRIEQLTKRIAGKLG
jgi:hypothetical protein